LHYRHKSSVLGVNSICVFLLLLLLLLPNRLKQATAVYENERAIREAYEKQRAVLQEKCDSLKSQVNMYKEKFEQFDGSLTASADVLKKYEVWYIGPSCQRMLGRLPSNNLIGLLILALVCVWLHLGED